MYPNAELLYPVVLNLMAPLPTAVLFQPRLFSLRAFVPTAVLLSPYQVFEEFLFDLIRALTPMAVL